LAELVVVSGRGCHGGTAVVAGETAI
jgi:hypothetical protein